MPNKKIVLASTSSYRKMLLEKLEIPFITDSPSTDETPLPNEIPEDLANRLAAHKAQSLAQKHPNSLIIGSDQVAYLGNTIFGKPGTHEKAVQQLKALQGQTVIFFTALAVLDTTTNTILQRGVPTRVTFRPLTDLQIENYLRAERPYDCAGSAKSEGKGITILKRIDGTDPNALIGLPLIALCDLFEEIGFSILNNTKTPE